MGEELNKPAKRQGPPFLTPRAPALSSSIPFSSRAFSTPVHPIQPSKPKEPARPSILPISLPPATLRPLAFRTFTKKHNLNLTSSALGLFASFIGKHCGNGWREEGLAETVLDEAARQWKNNGGGVLVLGEGEDLKSILRTLATVMDDGRLRVQSAGSHQEKFRFSAQESGDEDTSEKTERGDRLSRYDPIGISKLDLDDDEDPGRSNDPRRWLKIVNAFEHPRLSYNVNHKHFESVISNHSLLAEPAQKTHMFRQRYQMIHQRLLRNESFQSSAVASTRPPVMQGYTSQTAAQQPFKLTPIANLLGRGGSSHILLGLLSRSPSGLLTLNDLTGSISLDIQHARPSPEDGVWFTPGMIVVVDGQYEDQESKPGAGLDGNTGVGGTIGGLFVVFGMTGPPSERRETTLGVSNGKNDNTHTAAAGFGWVDFLGVGSERAVGKPMRALEGQALRRCRLDAHSGGRGRVILLGEVNLDIARSLQALRKVLAIYAAEQADQTPMVIVLMGNFVSLPVMAGGGSGGSIEYKEYFDSLASALSEYPTMLQNTTFVFVPGDNDPWTSTFSAGAATVIPRTSVPEIFTSRIRKVFGNANAEYEKANGKTLDGHAIWSTNPTRITCFGPTQEIVLFRDDISGRFQRNAIRFTTHAHPSPAAANTAANSSQNDDRANVPPEQMTEARTMDPDVEATAYHAPASKDVRLARMHLSPETQICRKLVKTVLDQGHLSPFPSSTRPVLWDYASSLQLYPLPTALVLMDAEAPAFAIGLDGCHIMNPGSLTPPGRKGTAQWMEYNIATRRGKAREARY